MGNEEDEITELKRKLEFVGGQVHLLVGFLLAVIDTHHDPDELGRHFEKVQQITLARTESTLVAEAYIEGQLDISQRLKPAIEKAQARKEAPRKDRRRD